MENTVVLAHCDTLDVRCLIHATNRVLFVSSTQAKGMNKKIGVVTTTSITHATPAAVYARSVDRDYEADVPEGCTEQVDIAQQVTRYTHIYIPLDLSCTSLREG